MGRVTDSTRIRTVRVRDGRLYAGRKGDHVAVEEPLDIRLNGQQLSLTMRTPGHDVELIHGFLHGEGLIAHREDVSEARYCDGAVVDPGSGVPQNTYNVMDVTTARPQLLPHVARAFTTSSACGVCGAESIDAVRRKSRYALQTEWRLDPRVLLSAARALSAQQAVFARTGGVHAAALVDLEGNLLVVREDVGRHNAVDKVIGWALMADRLPLRDCVLLVSSRASFEIVQKACMAGIPLLACVSAASSLAVETAEAFGQTLLGFARAGEDGDGRMNVYSGEQRLDLDAAEG
ncbi:formate dehydrogenase accessory sulfurtransferase FdhD [Brachybacterium saurashtrense]|uniref:Sulfur carrier protein FdhD n=1 Tax=Brachybacterium saurashtrense TaxID=556288 RepID=A0A345YR30_9MICO|nr:formate dehydrogenase accessory sulfurtransferase FdhD [Brachybacterium saurashtrense]AXK46382.1 formate dehydrogenase accessory sulfurtransferase FdhD [Brachybacterium saurashtrense]RRR24123.1 formate dehydrogenase accessory sulfurtransferase FdhD [Brachybacterium saurashtrense]